MQDKELYEKILGLSTLWKVEKVDWQMGESKVMVVLKHDPRARFPCPECGQECPTYDHRHRQWRHLDTCDFATMIEADVPRVCGVGSTEFAKRRYLGPKPGADLRPCSKHWRYRG